MALLLLIRFILSTENKRRDQEQVDDSYDDIYIERMDKDGQVERVKADKVKKLIVHDMRMQKYSIFFFFV